MQHNVRLGAFYLLIGELLVAILAATVRKVSDDLTTDQVIFFRNLMGLIALLPLVMRTGLSGLKTNKFFSHLTRSIIGVTAMYCYFWTLARIPLTEAFLVKLSAPLFLPFFAYLWLREPTSKLNFIALIVGFVGVMTILWPNLGENSHNDWPAMAIWVGVLGAILMALSKIAIRSMAATEPSQRIVFYYAVIASLITLPGAIINWNPVPFEIWGWLIALGIVASAGQLAVTKGYRTAPTGAIGVYAYSAVIYGALMGWWFWDEIPSWYTWCGAGLIISAGLINLKSTSREDVATKST